MNTEFSEAEREAIRSELLEWYDRNKRALPWRGVDDPYAVWVAEVMLQQTQVSTVLDYYEDWMERFPDVEALAEASRDEVLELWQGLGFYRRAKYLHESAERVVEEFDAEIPTTKDGLLELKGIGPYTAGAIASIAHRLPEPLVDGNVERVFSRLRAIQGRPKESSTKKRLWDIAGELVDPERPGDFNQALMELGSTVCTPASPSCMLCPLRSQCRGFEQGDPELYPPTRKRPKQRPVSVATSVVECAETGQFLVIRRPDEGVLSGLWEFPTVEIEADESVEITGELDRYLDRSLPFDIQTRRKKRVGSLVHHFSHLKITLNVENRVVDTDGQARNFTSHSDRVGKWVDESDLDEVPMSAAMRKVYRKYDEDRE